MYELLSRIMLHFQQIAVKKIDLRKQTITWKIALFSIRFGDYGDPLNHVFKNQKMF